MSIRGIEMSPRIHAALADASAARRRAFLNGMVFGAVSIVALLLLGAGLAAHLSGVPVTIVFLP